MLYTFKSAVSADVLMLDEPARKLISLIGKDAADIKGIVTVAQLPEAILQLRTAIEEDRARQPENPPHPLDHANQEQQPERVRQRQLRARCGDHAVC